VGRPLGRGIGYFAGLMGIRAIPPTRAARAHVLRQGSRHYSRLVRTYAVSAGVRTRVLAATDAVFDGFWLGILDPRRLEQADEHFYAGATMGLDGSANLYTHPATITGGLRPWEASAVRSLVSPGARVAVPGAGSGREVLWLLDHGFDAVGYEPNPALVAAGSRVLAAQGYPGRLHQCGRVGFPDAASACDLVLVGWGAYSHIPGRDRRLTFLGGARRRLPEGGAILVSFQDRFPEARLPRLTARIANVIGSGLGREPVEVGDVLNGTFVHRFTRQEVADELSGCGFAAERITSHPYPHVIGRAI
jgi:hypothetical protein